MALSFYNTLTRRLEEFSPLEPGHVGVYACGPTVYQLPHIGNYRTFIFNDILHRYLEWKGFDVTFVMNLTDVDDKIIDRARADGSGISDYVAPTLTASSPRSSPWGSGPWTPTRGPRSTSAR
jgi:cysteinyl-tRNA synthetase